MIMGDHNLHQTGKGGTCPNAPRCPRCHFELWPFYKVFSTLNARNPLFAGTTRNLTLAPSKMLRALVPIYQWFLKCRRILSMSVKRGRLEVNGRLSKRSF